MPALVLEGELGVLDAEQVHHGRVQVVDVVFGDVVAVVVGLAASAAVQLDTCSPNFLIQEFNTNDLHSEIFVDPIKFENGFITPPTGPGLGIELNEEVVKRQLSG